MLTNTDALSRQCFVSNPAAEQCCSPTIQFTLYSMSSLHVNSYEFKDSGCTCLEDIDGFSSTSGVKRAKKMSLQSTFQLSQNVLLLIVHWLVFIQQSIASLFSTGAFHYLTMPTVRS
jgi:hypothetical protein